MTAKLLSLRNILILLIIVFVIAAMGIGLLLLQTTRQDIRQQAAEGDGTVDILFVSPQRTVYVDEEVIVPLVAQNLNEIPLEGIQVVSTITFENTVPTDLRFEVAEISGLRVVGTPFQTTPNGGELKLAMVVTDPSQVFAPTGELLLGELRFTAPAEVIVYAQFDTTKTKVLQRIVGSEMLRDVTAAQFSIARAGGTDPNPVQPGTGGAGTGGGTRAQVPEEYLDSDFYDLDDLKSDGNDTLAVAARAVTFPAAVNPKVSTATSSSQNQHPSQLVFSNKAASSSAQGKLPDQLPQSGSSQGWWFAGGGLFALGLGWFWLSWWHKNQA